MSYTDRFRPSTIPIVLIHVGNPTYLHQTIARLRRVSSTIVLLGDDSNRGADVASHQLLSELRTPELDTFERHFVNYSTNDAKVERFCFARVFYLRAWMERTRTERCIYLDSDCVLLRRPEEIFPPGLSYVYNAHASDDPARMAATIHVSSLTLEFTLAFERLCHDIYVSRERFALIEPKIQYHQTTGAPGGVCDMTLYYLLTKELPVTKLLDRCPDGSTFDDNVNDSLGFNGPNTFVLQSGRKVLRHRGVRVEALCTDGQWVRLNNVHFQGGAKQYINALLPR
jgi:hypothetical protein